MEAESVRIGGADVSWTGRALVLATVAIAALTAGALVPSTAAGALTRAQCGDEVAAGVRCSTLRVPIDRTGAVPGRITLHVERRPASGPARGAILSLAGGPGIPATPITDSAVGDFGSALAGHDLVAFDSRGTGASGLLRCSGLQRAVHPTVQADQARRCARSLGPRRAHYTTADTIADIEDVRQALGIERFAIYGVSYGTKVALLYAMRHPGRVTRIVLDSVVPPDGPEPLNLDMLVGAPRVMDAVCRQGCGWTPSAGDDLRQLASLLRRPLVGYVVRANGRRRRAVFRAQELIRMLIEATPDPAVVRSAALGDSAPLLRFARTFRTNYKPAAEDAFSVAVFAATLCEEALTPWPRLTLPADRLRETAQAAARLPRSAFGAFTRGAAIAGSDVVRLCRSWPTASTPPDLPAAPLPTVPVLVLAGEADLRTPLETGLRLAGQLPNATILRVPATGHGALSSDPSTCTTLAVARFLGNASLPAPCSGGKPPPPPASPLPRSLREVAAFRRVPGRRGSTIRAVVMTIGDVQGELELGDNGGGLRGGRYRFDGDRLTLDRVEVVPGVIVSGRLRRHDVLSSGTVVVTGRGARGVLRIRANGVVTGRLAGRPVRVRFPLPRPEPSANRSSRATRARRASPGFLGKPGRPALR